MILHYHAESDCYFWGVQFNPGDGLVEDVSDSPFHKKQARIKGVLRPDRDFQSLDLSKIPQECDFIIYHTNGGLTILANVGGFEEYGESVQDALDAAIDHYITDCRLKDIL